MNWTLLSYTLPSTKSNSSARVALWRRLKRLGAVSPIGGLQVLPARTQCIEAFGWLAQEIRQEGGEALIMYVDQFEGLSNEQVIGLFCEAREKDYDELSAEAAAMEQEMLGAQHELSTFQGGLAKLRKQYGEIRTIDYFNCPAGVALEKRLEALERIMRGSREQAIELPILAPEAYRGKRWVTRPRPHVDRLACAWLIRQFIDAHAAIRYASRADEEEIAFDMQDGLLTHHGNLCTFETMIHAFALTQDAALRAIAELVHQLDLQDGMYHRPEAAGIDVLLNGWLLLDLADSELETRGIGVFAALYAVLSHQLQGSA